MTDPDRPDVPSLQLDILALLDDRFRLREDPERQSDLELTHARLRKRLRQPPEEDDPPPAA